VSLLDVVGMLFLPLIQRIAFLEGNAFPKILSPVKSFEASHTKA